MISLTRFCLGSLILSAVFSTASFAQDAAIEAAQQANDAAMQAAQQANQAAMQAAQQANQDAMQASPMAQQNMQQAIDNSQSQNSGPPQAAKPAFSIKPGKYPGTVIVRLKDKTRFANIYYTTDGWTPTEHSTLYTGPLTLSSTTLLQAIAVAPQHVWSSIASGMYTINGAPFDPCSAPSVGSSATSGSEIPVPLVFTSEVSSQHAEIGDNFPLAVARDVAAGGTLLAKKGTPAVATVTQVNPAGLNAKPGVITFQVNLLDGEGKPIPLHGVDSKEAPGVNRTAFYVGMLVPFAGVAIGASSLLVHGHNAVIEPGACVIGFMDVNPKIASQN